MNTHQPLSEQQKDDVMLRVHSIFYMRTVVRPLLVKAGLCVVALVSLTAFVSVPNVLSNMIEAGSFTGFVSAAVQHTEIYVQLLLAFLVGASVLVFKDALKIIGFRQQTL